MKNHILFVTLFTTTHWVKLAWPIINLDRTDGTLLGGGGGAAKPDSII